MNTEIQPTPEPDTGGEARVYLTEAEVQSMRFAFKGATQLIQELRMHGVMERIKAVELQALADRWSSALDTGCPSCGPVPDCDHIEGYHHALSDVWALLATPSRAARTAPLQDAEEVGE